MLTAFHFVGDTLRDGRPVPADGEWLEHPGTVEMCESGLHASLRPFHALNYAPGPVLCHVDLDGTIVHGDDKVVASRRRIVKRVDLTAVMRRFACNEALSVAHLWEMPDIVRQYLTTQDESIRDAAWDAAGAAAWDDAWAAARAAARAAAWDAARAAARDAAWDAAGAAARAAAWDAAWAAARDAAGDAAWAASANRFDALAYEALEMQP